MGGREDFGVCVCAFTTTMTFLPGTSLSHHWHSPCCVVCVLGRWRWNLGMASCVHLSGGGLEQPLMWCEMEEEEHHVWPHNSAFFLSKAWAGAGTAMHIGAALTLSLMAVFSYSKHVLLSYQASPFLPWTSLCFLSPT